LILVLVLLISFSVDIGNWWVHKRHLQLQADAAGERQRGHPERGGEVLRGGRLAL
jgi:hypothetical protein